jgi:3-(3-hydroxy-phenyl)propionate hydroxylase
MNDQHPSAETPPGRDDGVIVVGAGPVGCTAALLLADFGVPVALLERHTKPHPLPRAVHLDDEVARTLYRIGVSDDFLARSRSCSGLRLLDAAHQVMAEFRRDHEVGVHGFPQANMFHQPDLEQLLLARVEQHPLIEFRRGAEICGLDDPPGAVTAAPVRVRACLDGEQTEQTFTGRYVLGCDGANSTVRELAGITMDDLGFTERWLVVDVRADAPLDTWDGVEQVCDPARAATFMQVTSDRYRWEFQLQDSENEAALIAPPALGRLLRPWTGRSDLDGLEIIRTATYTFRARLAARFQAGRVFLLGDAAHLTPPFIGQGLAAGLRDADNLAWKIAHVLTRQAGDDLLASYDTERRPHAKAMIKKAVRVGWAMTGGQDRAAAIRRIALAAAVRSARIRDAIASTQTPRLKAGALRPVPRRILRHSRPRVTPIGGLIPNPLVSAGDGEPARLDAILRGRAAVLTAGPPSAGLMDLCRRHRLLLVQVSAPAAGTLGQAPAPQAGPGWVEVSPVGDSDARALRALTAAPGVSVLVRPDRAVADIAGPSQLPRLPWTVPAAAAPAPGRTRPNPSTVIKLIS